MSTPSRRRPTVPPLSELDAPGRSANPAPGPTPGGSTLWAPPPADPPADGGTAGGEPEGALAAPGPAERAAAQRAAAREAALEVARYAADQAVERASEQAASQAAQHAAQHAAEQAARQVAAVQHAAVREAVAQQAGAQRDVAEERAEVARAVLAEHAVSITAEQDRAAHRRYLSGSAVVIAAVALLAARVWLVGIGALFGTVPVSALDAAAAVALVLGLALLPVRRSTPGRARRLAVVLAVPALVAAGLALVQPVKPTSAPAAACPSAPLRGSTGTVVITAAATTRSGAGREYAPTGRFAAGCAVGVAGYCLGEPLPSGTGWADSRWLLLPRQHGPASLVSRHLSGEPDLPRFLPAAYAAPAGPDLPLLAASDCGADGTRTPGQTYLEDVVARADADNLAARSPRAANLGFAVWIAPDPATGVAPLLRGGAYRQLPGGTAGPAGRRTVRWDYPTLIRDLDPQRETQTVTVAVLAIACEAPGGPSAAGTAGVSTYEVVAGRLSGITQRLRGNQLNLGGPALQALDLDRLAATACAAPPV